MNASLLDLPDRLAGRNGYSWLQEQLESLACGCSVENTTAHLAFMRVLGQPANVGRLLTSVAGDSGLLDAVASRSYRHTNHFDKIVLVDSGACLGYRLTLHLWRPPYLREEVEDEQIHDHRFSFWSRVLVGRIVFQNYARDATGALFDEYQYIPERLGAATVGNYYINVGRSPLLETGRSGSRVGEAYYLPYHRIHRVRLSRSEMCCTIVLRGPRQKNYASVFSTSRKYDPSANTMYTRHQIKARLVSVLDALTL